MASQFGDGLFQAGMAGALLFNPDRAADPMAIAPRVRRVVSALLAAGTIRRGADGPLGSTPGPPRRQHWPPDTDRRDRQPFWLSGPAKMPLLVAALLANGLGRFRGIGTIGVTASRGSRANRW